MINCKRRGFRLPPCWGELLLSFVACIAAAFIVLYCNLCEHFVKSTFLKLGDVIISPKPQTAAPLLVGCSRLFIQYIRSHLPYCRPFLLPQPEDAPCRVDRDPLITEISRDRILYFESCDATWKFSLNNWNTCLFIAILSSLFSKLMSSSFLATNFVNIEMYTTGSKTVTSSTYRSTVLCSALVV